METYSGSQIDFNAVGDVTNLKAPAARMRYTRLRRAIESGTLTGTHGTPFQGGQEKPADATKKRRRSSLSEEVKAQKGTWNEDDFAVIRTRSGSRIGRAINSKEEYMENLESDEDSDDELPLVKRRASVLKRRDMKAEEHPSHHQGEMLLTQPVALPLRVGGTSPPQVLPPQPSQLMNSSNASLTDSVQPNPNAVAPSDGLSCPQNFISPSQPPCGTSAAEPSGNLHQVIVLDSDD